MNNKLTMTTLLALAGLAGAANAQIFTLADTNDASFEHDTDGTNSPSPIPLAGSQVLNTGSFEWEDLASDTTPNTAIFSGGTFTSSDWGGQGTFTSNNIDVSSLGSVTISAQFDGFFNTSSEFSNFFYQLDAGSAVTFGVGLEDITYTDEVVTVSALDVSAANNLVVGFDYSHNGSTDYFNVDSLTVVPEPGSFALLAGSLGMAFVMLKRRRA